MGITVTIEDGRPVGYLTADEFARKIGIAQATVRAWYGRGKLPRVLKIGNELWIPENESYPRRKKREKEERPIPSIDSTIFLDDAAELLSVHPETIRRWIRAGRLNASIVCRKNGYLIDRDELKEFALHHSRAMRNRWLTEVDGL